MITTKNYAFIWLKQLTVAVVFFAVGLNAASAWSWTDDPSVNTAISSGIGTAHHAPQTIADGSGGAIVTWFDGRNGNYDIFAQRVNANGTVQWTANGVSICTTAGMQWYPRIVADGSGGAIITWVDHRNGSTYDIYAQRIDANGTVQWTANGIALTSGLGVPTETQLATDGSGGAIITWNDSRNGNSDIFAQRVNASGTVQWTANGVAIAVVPDIQNDPQIISDGSGGAIISWDDQRTKNHDIYTQRIDSTGTVQWTANGVAVTLDFYPNNPLTHHLVIDGGGGVIFAWDDWITHWNIHMQKVDIATGILQWGANGITITDNLTEYEHPRIVADGSGGTIVTWHDYRNSNYDIYAQRVNADGVSQWTANGVAVSNASNSQKMPQIVADGSGGAVIAWGDLRNGNDDIYAQKMDASGTPQWAAGGVAVSTATDDQGPPQVVVDSSRGAIIAWVDQRGADRDIYAQRVYSNGDLVPTFTVGGTVSGLAAGNTVELELNSKENLSMSSNGSYTFGATFVDASSYAVTVSTQPDSPAQICSVSNGSGTISGADVSNVNVVCVSDTYTVGGSVSGLAVGNGVVLQNNSGDDFPVNGNGDFTFATALDDGSIFNVTVHTHPTSPSQTCTVSNGTGTIVGVNITNVNVTCVTNKYIVGGFVSGLVTGNHVVLQNNGSGYLSISANGGFTFTTALDDESSYVVTVLTDPTSPNQTCTVSNGSGTLDGANISNVNITCVTNTYTIGGSISGLAAGNNVVLQNNGSDNLTLSADGSYTFATALDDESSYMVTVLTQPATPNQICTMSNGSGTLAGANIVNVNVSCVTTYTVGGVVSGLAASNSVTMQNNGGDFLSINADGSFTFVTALVDGSNYTASILIQPDTPNQTCTVANGSGAVAGVDVTTVSVSCVTDQYTVNVTVTDLITGNSITLQNNAGDDLAIDANGSFTFLTPLDDGSGYSVTILTQPEASKQTCRIYSGTGMLSGENVIDVQVSCKGFPWAIFLPAILGFK